MNMNASTDRTQAPIVATMIGDPCGIGPEVVVKALAEGVGAARQLLVGDAQVVRDAAELTKAALTVRPIARLEEARYESGCIDVLDPGTLRPGDVTIGRLSAACGRAVTEWWNITTALAREKRVAAIVKAPTNSEAIRLGGGAPAAASTSTSYLFLITGPLRVVHLTDHIPLREVFGHVRQDAILRLIRLIHDSLVSWGVAAPRIGVAGINPHAYGDEERQHIAPAIDAARALGIDAQGPVSPDSLFRLCAEGAYDCVIAHYHDQGHIAVKTWRFDGNCAVMLGEPFLRVSVAHGTAFDIAGRGIADHRSMASAMHTAAMLAAGRGFPRE
jgi:4-hydroxy-L-threonine phosphate dehydrogenase PdxA